jgi:hypothetical protein
MAYDRTEIFNRLGVLVRWHNELEQLRSDIDSSLMSEVYTDFDNDDAEDRESIKRILDAMISQRSGLDGDKSTAVAQVQEFITNHLAELLNSPETSLEKVVDDLIAAMENASDTVDGNTVYNDPGASTNNNGESLTVYDTDGNSTGTATFDAVDQMARPDNYFRAVCVSDTQAGEETWAIHSSVLGEAPTQAVTAEDWDWDAAGIERINIAAADVEQTQGSGVISDASIEGLVRGVNADEDGNLYLSTSRLVTSSTLEEDEYNQLDFSFTTSPVFGDDTDTDGVVHITVDADPDTLTVVGGVTAGISGVRLAGVASGNLDSQGLLYVEVTESGGTYTVDLYKNIDRATAGDKVATGTTTSLPDEITLSEANGSGLAGTLTLDWHEADDDTILVRPPKYHVKLYRSSSRAEDDLLAYASTYGPNVYGSPLTLTAANDSTIAGTVTLTYTSDDTNATLQLPYYLIHFYSDSDRENLVARAGSLSAADNLDICEVNGSGLSGHIDLDGTSAVSNIVLTVGYSAGDYFEFATDSLEEGTFQSFFRDNIGQALPSVTNGTETVAESLAGGS